MILQHRFKSKDRCFEIEIIKEYGQLPKITCYAGQMNQVFMNLLSNAIDALKSHLSILIPCRKPPKKRLRHL
jgi:signal transduction histidine kinase